jgi:serine/threonine protein kinase
MDERREDKNLGRILFKHYKLKKKIGEGSFGQIYIAIHIETKEEYAVKIVSKIIFNIT